MKKNVKNRLFEQQYNNVMKRLGTAVRRILESEIHATVNPKSYDIVRDAIVRRNYDEDWASSVRPLSKLDADELLHRYVSALLIFGKECPQTEDEIDEIGVFAEYAHKFIDEMGGTLDDIKTLYGKNDKVQSHNNVYKIENISDLTSEDFYNPSMNTSFANYKDNCIFCRGNKIGFAVKVVDFETDDAKVVTIFRDSFGKALEDFDVILLASINELKEPFFKIEVSEVVKKFFNVYRDIITDELYEELEERAETFYYKCFEHAESVDDVVNVIEAMNGKVQSHNNVYKIENISELTLEDFYNPSMNTSFANYKDNCILCRGNKIGFAVKVVDFETDDERVVTIFRDSFGKALEDFDVILLASINELKEPFFKIEVSEGVKKFLKAFRGVITEELDDEIEGRTNDFYYKCFEHAESVDDVVKGIKKMENNF